MGRLVHAYTAIRICILFTVSCRSYCITDSTCCLLSRCAALDTFEAMLASGSRPHAAVYSSIIDVLWQTGIPWAQAKALHLFNSAVQCVASLTIHPHVLLWQGILVTGLPVHSLGLFL